MECKGINLSLFCCYFMPSPVIVIYLLIFCEVERSIEKYPSSIIPVLFLFLFLHYRSYQSTFILIDSGTNVVTRVVAAEATTLKERTKVMAHMSIAQGLGFSFGPGKKNIFFLNKLVYFYKIELKLFIFYV